GVFSLLKGDNPFHSRPALRNFTRRPTTSETGSRARSSSRNCGVNRMVIRGILAPRILANIGGEARRRERRTAKAAPCPGYPQERLCAFYSSWPGSSRPSTSSRSRRQGVDARHKAGHDEEVTPPPCRRL